MNMYLRIGIRHTTFFVSYPTSELLRSFTYFIVKVLSRYSREKRFSASSRVIFLEKNPIITTGEKILDMGIIGNPKSLYQVHVELERKTGLEPATYSLGSCRSTR